MNNSCKIPDPVPTFGVILEISACILLTSEILASALTHVSQMGQDQVSGVVSVLSLCYIHYQKIYGNFYKFGKIVKLGSKFGKKVKLGK